MAPISRPPPASLIPRSSATPPRSTTTYGRLMRSFSQSKVSRPPAITQARRRGDPASRACRPRGRLEQLECRHYIANRLALSCLPLDERRQRLRSVRLAGLASDISDLLRLHRRAAQDVVATASASAHSTAPPPAPIAGSPMPLAPTGLPGPAVRPPPIASSDRDIENRRRLVVVQPIGERRAVVRVVDQLLAAHVAEALDAAAVDLSAEASGCITVPTSATAEVVHDR